MFWPSVSGKMHTRNPDHEPLCPNIVLHELHRYIRYVVQCSLLNPKLLHLHLCQHRVIFTTMPFPFGVSVGDFIACIDLIRTVVESLQSAHGSAAQYHSLIASLESLESALIRVRDVNIHDPTLRVALHRVAIKSRSSLSTFLAKIEKYQPSLQLGGSGIRFKDNIRKIQWAVYAKEDITIFQNEITGHVQAIVLLLLTFQT
jgi:hypothetical protein